MSIGKNVPVTIDFQTAKETLAKAVLDRGENYVYQSPTQDSEPDDVLSSCYYFDQAGSPSCIVGHVLSQLGVSPFKFDSDLNSVGLSGLIDEDVLVFTGGTVWIPADETNQQMYTSAYQLLAEAQDYQDSRFSWGAAVAKAAREVRRMGDSTDEAHEGDQPD